MPELGAGTDSREAEFLFDKTYECPVCYEKSKQRTVKAGRMRLLQTDMDLRPVYEQGEPLKYDVIVCPHCGYSALARFFTGLSTVQTKAIKEQISSAFTAKIDWKETYTYEEAVTRYKLSLISTMVKRGKTSERAYICLKLGWLYRSMSENMDPDSPDYDRKQTEAKEKEREFLKNALDGFQEARQSENYPMCGMDEITVEYLIAVLAMENEEYDVASKLISGVIASPSANSRMKDKARDMKDILLAKIREKNAN